MILVEGQQRQRGIIERPRRNEILHLHRVIHDAEVIRLAVLVVAAAMPKVERVPELVHEGARFNRASASTRLNRVRGPAAERDHEIVAGQFGDAARSEEVRVVVAEYRVAKHLCAGEQNLIAIWLLAIVRDPEVAVGWTVPARIDRIPK